MMWSRFQFVFGVVLGLSFFLWCSEGSLALAQEPGFGDVGPSAASSFPFCRGDANTDGSTNIADAIAMLNMIIIGAVPTICADATDANDDGQLDIGDPIFLLSFLFTVGSPPILAPVGACGPDTTVDALDCQQYTGCGAC